MNWKLDDVVQLNSGGPRMTIEEMDETHAYCVWFDDKKVLKRDAFKFGSLKKPVTFGSKPITRT